MTNLTIEDKEKTMEKLFNSKFSMICNHVCNQYYDAHSVQIYQLSDASVIVSVSDCLDPNALFIHLFNYGAYLELLYSNNIWGDARMKHTVTDRLANYIEKKHLGTKNETN